MESCARAGIAQARTATKTLEKTGFIVPPSKHRNMIAFFEGPAVAGLYRGGKPLAARVDTKGAIGVVVKVRLLPKRAPALLMPTTR